MAMVHLVIVPSHLYSHCHLFVERCQGHTAHATQTSGLLSVSVVIYPFCYDSDYGLCRYPAVYCVVVLPTSIARWIGFVQVNRYGANFVPAAATFACGAIFRLSGFLNVVLLLTTKSGLFGISTESDSEVAPAPLPLRDLQQEGRLPD